MIAVARIVKERRRTVARTMRETFGVGLSDLGDGLTWGEALILIEEAASDPSTQLGAELAGWAYPASIPQLIGISAQVGNQRAAEKLMPWTLDRPGKGGPSTTAEEIAVANAALEAGIVFSE